MKKILFLILLTISGLVAQKKLVFNTCTQLPYSNKNKEGFLDLIVIETCKRMGYGVIISHISSERALRLTNTGVDDGNFARVAGIEKIYPNLIRVPEKLLDIKFMVFTRLPKISFMNWQKLSMYDIAYIRGWKIVEEKVKTKFITKVRKPHQLFSLLQMKRVDMAICDYWQALYIIKKQKIPLVYAVEPPLETKEMFIYLHKKHKKLAGKMAHVIKQLKQDGTYQKFYKNTMEKWFK